MELTWIKLFDSRSSVNISFPWLCQRPETDEPKQREGLLQLGVGYCGACGEVKWSGAAGNRWHSRTSHPLLTGDWRWKLGFQHPLQVLPSSSGVNPLSPASYSLHTSKRAVWASKLQHMGLRDTQVQVITMLVRFNQAAWWTPAGEHSFLIVSMIPST